MRFRHTFRVKAPLTTVVEFHRRSASMAAITPPPLIVRMHVAPSWLRAGDVMDFTLWAGPIPLRWTARIEAVTPIGFSDRQMRGPFARWLHRHTFVRVDDAITEVVDEIEAELKRHPLWGPIGLVLWIGLPVLFAYRGWRTRRLLETGR
ncbi:MAG: hypothetical protein N2439_10605 [Anaerolineae bacterium]|nr:hypothetical protein [Anaerolineae bacterium]